MCLKLRPTAVDALNNYAVLMAKQNQYDIAVAKFYEAIQIEDDEDLAMNLVKVLMADPDKRSPLVLKATEASKLMASKYDIPALPATTWAKIPYNMLPPVAPQVGAGEMLVSGSGFVLNDEGYVLTNRHVVLKMTTFLVITADQKKFPADVVMIDKERDLALLKIKKLDPAVTLTPVTISKLDYPAEGQQCYAVGYPLMDVLGATIKITQGIISGKAPGINGVDVLVDAKVNPGNSGGPLLDKYGQVIGIVTMKTYSDTEEDSYGMAISGGTIKKFLEENKIKVASEDGGTALAPEDVVKKVRAGTVCILAH
jgi:S1-C subfamily serine protease